VLFLTPGRHPVRRSQLVTDERAKVEALATAAAPLILVPMLDILAKIIYIYPNFEKLINTKKGRRYITAAPNLQRNIRESKNFPSS
jgi:hypothetical protein